MKNLLQGIFALSLITATTATELLQVDPYSANEVLETYADEPMGEAAQEQEWIHDFEDEAVGSEMEHLSAIKPETLP